MGTFTSNLQKEVNFLPEWEAKKPLNDKYSYQLDGQPIFSSNQDLKTKPNGVVLDSWVGDLIINHVRNPKIVDSLIVDKFNLKLDDTYVSSRDAYVTNLDRSQDYFRHLLNINNYTRYIIREGNYTYIGNDGTTKPDLSVYQGTSYENEDPVIFGFDIILDNISSPLLNGSVEDFISIYGKIISEIASRQNVIYDFKNQLKKIFKTKGEIQNNNASVSLGSAILGAFGLETSTPLISSDFDSYAWGSNDQESTFTYGKKSYLSHYIQKIVGLDQLVERNTTETHKPFSEWPKNKLTISFYEDVSGTIGALAHLYKLLYWSVPNGKSIIPENLLRFNCDIVISEIRNYKRVMKAKEEGNIKVIKDNVSKYIYSLKECQFFFSKMPHDADIDLSNTKVYGDGGPGYDIEMNWKFASTKFQKWTKDGYKGYNTGTIWKKGKESPKFNFSVPNIPPIVFDDYNSDNYHGNLSKNKNEQNTTTTENLSVNNVNIYKSTYNDSNKDYVKFINKYQLVKAEGFGVVEISNPTDYYNGNIVDKSGKLDNIAENSNKKAVDEAKANTDKISNTENIFLKPNKNTNITSSNTFNIFNTNNKSITNTNNSNSIKNIFNTTTTTSIISTVSTSLINIYKMQNNSTLNNSMFTTIGNIFTMTKQENNSNNNSNIVNIYTKPNTIIKNSIIYAIFNIYTKQNKDSLKNSVFTKIGNIFKNKI
jgi:hypothetical protein